MKKESQLKQEYEQARAISRIALRQAIWRAREEKGYLTLDEMSGVIREEMGEEAGLLAEKLTEIKVPIIGEIDSETEKVEFRESTSQDFHYEECPKCGHKWLVQDNITNG